jgi:hypothetical protein
MKNNNELEKKLKWHSDTLTDMVGFIYDFASKHKLLSELEVYCDESADADGYPKWEEGCYLGKPVLKCGN